MSVKEGDICPDFELKNQFGETVKSESLIGKKNLVIYFYPKDDTPGCTKEACSFRDSYSQFTDAGCEVVGISSDSEESHREFAKNHNLPYILLADTKKQVRKSFGVPGNLFGLIPGRVTYVIDKKGVIRGVFNSQVDFTGHVKEAMKVIETISD